jgi:glycosyltransferase involved in cell wall biosynthesis
MITVITAVFNSEKTLLETLESVYEQKDVYIEHIIIDGDSKDQSKIIIESFIHSNQGHHVRFVYLSENDQGIYDAINKGLKRATGEIVGILNSDDTYQNNGVLKKLEASFHQHNVDAVYGNVNVINEKRKVIRKIRTGRFKLGDYQKSIHPAHPTFYVKKEIIDQYGYYDLNYKIASDGEYMFRLLEIHKISHHYLNENLVIMKDGGISQRGINSTLTIIKETKHFMKKHYQRFSVLMYMFHKFKKIKEYKKDNV